MLNMQTEKKAEGRIHIGFSHFISVSTVLNDTKTYHKS